MADVNVDVYNVLDENGNVIDTLEFPEGGSLYEYAKINRQSGATSQVATGISGEGEQYTPLFTPQEAKELTTVTLDKKTGDITVSAPEFVIEHEGVKKNLEDTLTTLSRLYKSDHNYAIPMQDGSTKRVDEIISELNDPNNAEGLAALVDSIYSMRKQEYGSGVDGGYAGDRKTYNIGDDVKLNDAYFTYRNAIALGNDLKDTTRQSVPKQLAEAAFLRALESYDEETSTVEYGDLMKNGWNRDKHSDDELKELNAALERYFAEGDYEDTDELARNIALYEFINNKTPDVAWFRNVYETVGQAFGGVVKFKWDADVYLVAGPLLTIVGGIEEATESLYNNLFQTGDDNAAFIKNEVQREFDFWENFKEEQKKDLNLLSDTQAAANEIGYGIAKLAALIVAGNELSAMAKAGLGKVSAAAYKASASAAEAASTASGVLTGMVTGGKITANVVESIATVAKGVGIMCKYSSPSMVASMANVVSVMTGAKATSVLAGLVAETFAESVTANPKLFYNVLHSGNLSPEAKQTLWDDFIGNSVGLAAGVTIGKGLTKLGETTTGRALSHNASVAINKLFTKIGDAKSKAQAKIHGFDDITDYIRELNKDQRKINKADAIAIREMLRAAHKEVAESGYVKVFGNADEILDDLAEAEEASIKLMRMNNAIDDMRSRGKTIAAEWYLSGRWESFKGADDALQTSYDALYKLEKTAKNTNLRRVGKLAISQDTSNYIEGMARRDIVSNILQKNGKFLSSDKRKAFQNEIEYLNEAIAKYEGSVSEEIKAAAKDVLDKTRQWTLEANNLLLREGLLNTEEIANLRASGLWGNNGELYVPMFREKDLEKVNEIRINRIQKNMVENPYHYVAGTQSDFLDPLAASRLYMRKYADAKARQNVAKVYTSLGGAKSDLLFDGMETQLVTNISDGARAASYREVNSAIKDIAKEVRASSLTNEFLDRSEANLALKKAVTKADRAEASYAIELGKTLDDYSPSVTQTKASLIALDDTTADVMWDKNFSYYPTLDFSSGPVSVKEYVIDNYSELPRSTRKMIHDKVAEMNYLKGSAFEQFATASDVNDIVKLKTGYNSLGEMFTSSKFDSMSNKDKMKVLKDLLGEEKGTEIYNSALEYAHGMPQISEAADVDIMSYRNAQEAFDESYEVMRKEAQEEGELAAEVKKVKALREGGSEKLSAEDAKLLRKWAGEDLPDVPMTARARLARAEKAAEDASTELNNLRKAAAEETKLYNEVESVRKLRQGIVDGEISDDLLKDLNSVKKWNGKLSAADKKLIEKWDGVVTEDNLVSYKKWVNKELPEVTSGARNAYDKAIADRGAINTLARGTEIDGEFQTEASGAAQAIVEAQKKINSESVMYALASAEYGGMEDVVSEGAAGSLTNQMIIDNYINELKDGTATKGVWAKGSMTWDELVEYDPDFEKQVQRDIMGGTKWFADTPEVQDIAKRYAETSALAQKNLRLAMANEDLDYLTGVFNEQKEVVDATLQNITDDMIEKIMQRPVTNKNIMELCRYYGVDVKDGSKYFSLRAMTTGGNKAALYKDLKSELRALLKEKGFTDDNTLRRISGAMSNEIVSRLENEYDQMTVMFQDIAPKMVDQRGLYGEVRRLSSQISKAYKDTNNVVAIQNNLGQVELYETDPLVASFLNHENLPQPMSGFAKANYLLSKTFRLGTTGVNITSMVNQTFRDFGNAFIGGNLYRVWSSCAQEMREVLGDNVIGWIQRSDPEMAADIVRRAEKYGTDVNEEALEAIRKYGESVSPQVTETEVYRRASESQASLRLGKMGKGVDAMTDRNFNKVSGAINTVEDKMGAFNKFRESSLRVGVYNNAFADAVKRGYSYANAKTFATFAMNNATTNFGRLTEHFSNLQQSVPFLGAAINGTKSFWRLVAVDPVGVMGRLIGGIALPTMALAANSLQDKTNREVYRNIKEYEKEDNMIFVIGGQVMSIPIPQEISSVVAPFRRMVENMYDGNTHDYTQLAINDIIGLSPIDLDGFTNIDAYTLMDGTSKDNFFVHNFEPGIAKLFSQLAPVPAKFAAMLATGIDPYTMKKIDRSWRGVDIDTGESVILNDYSSELGKLIASAFKGTPFEMSGAMADKLLGSIFGTAPVDYAGWLITLGRGISKDDETDIGTALQAVGQGFTDKLLGPVTVNQYRTVAEAAWKDAVSRLYDEREQLLMSDEWQDYAKKRRNAKTTEELEKLKVVRDNLVADYYNDVQTVVNNLQKNYGSEFTAAKYGAVLALSTLYVGGADTTEWGQYTSDEMYQDARKKAIDTMYKMGFQSPRDYSAFGYVRTSSSGEVFVDYATPMAILDYGKSTSNAGNIHLANLSGILESKGLTTYSEEYKKMQEAVTAIYAKEKLSNADYEQINKLYRDWDTKVMISLYPYMSQYGIEAFVNDGEIVQMLNKVIKVPSDYEVTDKGRYISKSSRLNKQRGFVQSYIEYIYNKVEEVNK